MFAAAAAADAQHAVGLAPSMPAGDTPPGDSVPPITAAAAAGPLAELAAALARRLDQAAGQAERERDREALEAAAAGAGLLRQLLADNR